MILKKIPIEEVFELMDKQALFKCRWQMKDYNQAEKMLKQIWEMSLEKKLWELKCVYKIYNVKINNNIIVFDDNTELLFSQSLPKVSTIGLQLVTAGKKVKQYTSELAENGQIEKQFLLHGLAAEFTDGLAVWCNKVVEKEIGIEKSKRLSPGYPIWPELSEQKKIFVLLKPEDIEVTLSKNFQMIPEYSTSAIVLPKI